MCGIFGVINLNNKPVDIAKAGNAAATLAHRGPDDYSTFLSSSGCAYFHHYRLSIIGLSELGRQPMTTEDGRYTILFNGEIFNYREIQNSKPGVMNLISGTDTEVLLKLFALEGENCLTGLRGMFAFVIWDEKEKTLFAARDRFGIKPLYYLHNENEFIFSSEIKAIKRYKEGALDLDYDGIDSFLRWGSIAPPLTIYKEIKSLPAGSKLKINTASPTLETMKLEVEKWWYFKDLLDTDTSILHKGSHKYDNEAREKIHNALIDSVNAHMVADVEVGAFLSGGTDSTSIVSLMKKCGHERIKTISIIFPGNKLDESKYSSLAAQKYKTDHYEYRLREDEVVDELNRIIEAMDQPTIDGVNTYFVSKAASSFGLKVVLSGLGGDEVFGGYMTFKHLPRIALIMKIPFNKIMMQALVPVFQRRIPAKAIEYLQNPEASDSAYRLFRGLFTDEELRELGWNPVADSAYRPGSSIEKLYPRIGIMLHGIRYSPLQYVSYLESTYYMSNQLLRDSDVFSMAHSLELRVPFVDDHLYSVALKYIDEGYDPDNIKRMLTNAVGDLPDAIIKRKKMGFTFPFDDWMKKGKLGKTIKEKLLDENYNDFNKLSVSNLIKKYETGKIHWSRVWALYVLNRFLKP
jgi:asparagine synthase (glutamine-hydrolysing)